MEGERAVDDVEEELNVRGVGKVAGHGLKHAGNQPDPVELVQQVDAVHFLKKQNHCRGFVVSKISVAQKPQKGVYWGRQFYEQLTPHPRQKLPIMHVIGVIKRLS